MKRKTFNELTKKHKPAASRLGSMCPVTARQQAFYAPGFLDAHIAANRKQLMQWLVKNAHCKSPFYGLSKTEAQAKFEQMLGQSKRGADSDEYRRPAPLGPLRVEYDEDGVPTYLD